jgi:multisubunit Na+/H+ antiporter MnhC subunit
VPRPTLGRFRIGRYVVRGSWRIVRAAGRRRGGETRDTLLGLFAPAATLLLLVVWLVALVLGFGLVLFALRSQLNPSPQDLGTTMYYAAGSILTLGSGEIAATGPVARAVVVVSAVSGLGVVALVVTFLFSLYGSYQRREVQVVTLQAAAGAPPSAVTLLETYGRLDLTGRLPDFFAEWERWAAEVLDTHVAYPLLGFFRSSHDNLSWISALGTVLDAASLVLTTTEGLPRGEAELFRRVGSHLVEDITNLGFRSGVTASADAPQVPAPNGVDRIAFDEACARLVEAGYRLAPREVAWAEFEGARAAYAGSLQAMAAYWATPTNSWLEPETSLRSPAHRPIEDADDVVEQA